MTPIRVAIADDQSLIRLALRTLTASEPDIDIVGEAADGQAAWNLVVEHHPDVLLLDIRMPIMDGLAVLKRINSAPHCATTRVIIMTTFDIDEYIFTALENGAAGFITKDFAPTDILHAIRVIAAGESLLSPTITRRVIEHFTNDTPTTRPHPRLNALTPRELDILGWVATGLSNHEIAQRLVVSPATIRTHVGRTITKLGARDRAQLVVIAYRSGVPIPE